uniref:Endo/exonuclease/phosphatase domain-containing protein n=1 Tax=Rhabditophanes sp. KR3021 TaxID=114890 RepID=A0AC35U7I9_9BILA
MAGLDIDVLMHNLLLGDFIKIDGVGFLIAAHLKPLVDFSQFVAFRLGRLDLNLGGIIVALVVVCAPILNSDDSEEFYEELDKLLGLKSCDELITGGDFNARLAAKHKRRTTTDTFSPAQNENGDALSNSKKRQTKS